MNEPPGRLGSFRPARVRRIAWDRDLMASFWPTTRLCSSSSIFSRRVDSSSVSLKTGMPVELANTSAIRSSSTSEMSSMPPDFQWRSFSERSVMSFCSLSRREAAPSKSCASMADSFSIFSLAIRSSMAFSSGGAVIRRMRNRAPASSIRSMALSGRKRSEI
ncbi:hypothetical protein AHiyo4_03350 [Arthrobacter sp. Hiyo4]|nr:hypothetical protein AHiyo4_03350 [Arthrobacter sp. Hiyo4]